MQPAFEPFLFMSAVLPNSSNLICSLQFRSDDLADYHYCNFVFIQSLPESACVQIVAVADLPLSAHAGWNLIMITQTGKEKNLGRLYRDAYGVWNLESIRVKLPDQKQGPIQLVFIGGAPKSGTTWVEKIANQHPDMLATGENNLFAWPSPDGLAALMESAPPPYYSFAVQQNTPFRTQAAMCYAGRAERVLRQIAMIADVCVIADKSPAYCSSLPEIFLTLPDSKYIHCVRHPLDVAVSRFFHERNLLIDRPELSLLPQDRRLRDYVRQFENSKAKPGDMFKNIEILDLMIDSALEGCGAFSMAQKCHNIYIIKYEDLLNNYGATVRSLFQFCGLEVDDNLLEIINQHTHFAALSGGRDAGDDDPTHFFRKGIAGDHKNYMTKSQIEYARRRTLLRCEWYRTYFEAKRRKTPRKAAAQE
jgi:hypothetical protein